MKRVLSLNKTNYEAKLILAEIHLKEEDIESAYLLLKECFTYNYKRKKYLLKIHELGSLLEGFDISRKYVSQSLSQAETEGIANYLEAKNYFKSKNEKCIQCAIVLQSDAFEEICERQSRVFIGPPKGLSFIRPRKY